MNTKDLQQMSCEEIIAAFMSPATCPTSIPQGSTRNVTVAASGGTSPFIYKLYADNVEKATYGPTTDTSHVFSYKFSEAAGSHTYKGYVKDSCPQEVGDQCAVTISAPAAPAGIGAGALLAIGLLGAGVLGAVMLSRRETR